jgi:hypothetical protein
LHRPVAVFLVNSFEVVVNNLVNLNVSDTNTGAAFLNGRHNIMPNSGNHQQEKCHEKKRPSRGLPAFTREHLLNKMISIPCVTVCSDRVKVIVGE